MGNPGWLFVEIVQGGIWPYCDEGPPVKTLCSDHSSEEECSARTSEFFRKTQHMPYATELTMGASIGVEGNPTRSGTLGGFVELFKNEVQKTCGLTCSHVFKGSVIGNERKCFGKGTP